MLTNSDREAFEATGMITPDRVKALQAALRTRARDARAAAAVAVDERAAAALRGKANAYDEVVGLAGSLLAGNSMRKPRWSRRNYAQRAKWLRKAFATRSEKEGLGHD